jgi:nucleotide-binding universal stress UspA family protein
MKPLFRRILVPHDLSEHANRALALASELAAAHRGRLLVLHTIMPIEPVAGFPDGIAWSIPVDDIAKTARKTLERMVTRVVGRRRVSFECEVVVGTPFDRIMAAARRADSIVMSTLGRTGLAHVVIGSVAEKVVRHSPIPVLTLRPVAVAGRVRRHGSRARPVELVRRAGRRR